MLNTDFKILPKEVALEYLKQYGLSLDDDCPDIVLESNSSLTYILPNNELMLYPLNSVHGYPSLIFTDIEKFNQYKLNGHFPIDRKYMTYFEYYYKDIKDIENFKWHHEENLSAKLQVSLPFKHKDEIEPAFEKMQLAIKTYSISKDSISFDDIETSFGLSVIRYLIEFENSTIEIDDRFETYNKEAYPFIIKRGRIIDVISNVKRANSLNSKNSFNMFSRWIGL